MLLSPSVTGALLRAFTFLLESKINVTLVTDSIVLGRSGAASELLLSGHLFRMIFC